MLSEIATQAAGYVQSAALALGAIGGLWVAISKLSHGIKASLLENTASKEDLARLEGKVDLIVDVITSPAQGARALR